MCTVSRNVLKKITFTFANAFRKTKIKVKPALSVRRNPQFLRYWYWAFPRSAEGGVYYYETKTFNEILFKKLHASLLNKMNTLTCIITLSFAYINCSISVYNQISSSIRHEMISSTDISYVFNLTTYLHSSAVHQVLMYGTMLLQSVYKALWQSLLDTKISWRATHNYFHKTVLNICVSISKI